MSAQLVRNNGAISALPGQAEVISALVLSGDLSKLTPEQKVIYYKTMCERVGLDPTTQPFGILKLNGKEILYCGRAGAQQLSKLHKVSHQRTATETVSEVFVVHMRASLPDGRYTESIGAVNIANLKGEALANALMKCETKAKRRATLDLLGLGMLDETETDSIPGAERLEVPNGPVAPLTPSSSLKPTVEAEPITNAQYQDLLAVVRSRRLSLTRVKSHLASRYGVKTARDLTQAQYAEVAADLRHMESPAAA